VVKCQLGGYRVSGPSGNKRATGLRFRGNDEIVSDYKNMAKYMGK